MKTTVVKTLMPREIDAQRLQLAKALVRKARKLIGAREGVFDFKLTMRTGRNYARELPSTGKPVYKRKLETNDIVNLYDLNEFKVQISKLVARVLTKQGVWVGVDLTYNYDWSDGLAEEIRLAFVDTNQRATEYVFTY